MKELSKPATKGLIETIVLVLLFIGLIFALYRVLEVFFGVLTFALIFAVSFSAAYERLVIFVRGRRKLAGVLYALIVISIVALPLIFLISAMSRHLKQLIPWLAMVKTQGLPPLPPAVSNLPLVGPAITSFWLNFKESPKATIGSHEHQFNMILHHIITGGLGVLGVAFQFIIGIIISAFFLERGAQLLTPVKNTVKHLPSEQDGEELIAAVTQAIKGVSIGVMGTGFIVSFVAWTGLALAGIPFAVGLAALIFFLVVIQVGATIVWLPLIVMEIIQGDHLATLILCIYFAIIIGIELVVRPILIARSGKLPFLVLFLGVVGGLAAWGFTGMFKGAIVTAIFYTVFNSWLASKDRVNQEN